MTTENTINTWALAECKSGYYGAFRLVCDAINGMDAIKGIFPDGKCNIDNLILFSTSGVHGHYGTIEEERENIENGHDADGVTFVIIKPRQVVLQFGNVFPKTTEDFEYLKKLRASAKECFAVIGEPD